MAFTPDTLSVIAQPIGGTGIRFLSYRTDDSSATVTGAGYFVGAAKFGVRGNDLVFVTPIEGAVEPYILVIEVDESGNGTGVLSPADTALQPSDIGVSIASAAQGALADTALQPAAIGVSVQAYDLDLTAIAALSTSANQVPYATGVGTWALSSLTAFGRSLIDDADNTAARTTLGLGTSATVNTGTSGATIPLLNAANAWSAVQTHDNSSASPVVVSRASSATNASVTYTTSGGTVFAGTGNGLDFAIGASNNLNLASSWFKINSTTATFQTDIALGTNKAISFAGTGAATTRTNLTLTTGTYTPTLTNTTNIAASTAYVCQWMRVDNVITVSGKVDIDVTAAGNALLGMSLPVASALTTDIQAGGTFVSNAAATPEAGCIFADGTNDRASFKFIAVNTANNTFFFSFTYLVL